MKIHRVREAKSIDGFGKPHLFVEMEQDSWMEVEELPSHESIEEYNKKIHSSLSHITMYDTRTFEIGIIRDWKEAEPIIER